MILWYKNAIVSFLRDHSKCDFLIFNALNYTKKRFVYFPLDLIYVFVPAIQIELRNNLEDKQKLTMQTTKYKGNEKMVALSESKHKKCIFDD